MGSKGYYVPDQSKWPIIGSIGLGFFAVGAATFIQDKPHGPYLFTIGMGIIIYMMYGWFSNVIEESQRDLYSAQLDRSFRWGMIWFIFSEVMFFAAFFGVLAYIRLFAVPWLGGASNNAATHEFLWSGFIADWPLLVNPDNLKFVGPIKKMGPWPLPTINTLILLASSITVSFAHHAIIANKRLQVIQWLTVTVLLGVVFIFLQAFEYYEAYHQLGLKLNSGIYGSTFFMLTGFHGAHVTIGTIMLFTMLIRSIKGHFRPNSHFAFEATAWYWHFVDVIWLVLFIFVYILPLE